jgi:hypothetical protein
MRSNVRGDPQYHSTRPAPGRAIRYQAAWRSSETYSETLRGWRRCRLANTPRLDSAVVAPSVAAVSQVAAEEEAAEPSLVEAWSLLILKASTPSPHDQHAQPRATHPYSSAKNRYIGTTACADHRGRRRTSTSPGQRSQASLDPIILDDLLLLQRHRVCARESHRLPRVRVLHLRAAQAGLWWR